MTNRITAGNATNGGTSISSDTSGVLELRTGSTPTTALTISTGQVVTVVNPIQGGTITSGTAVASTSGTSIDFTGIPSWAKRVTVMLSAVSTSGTSLMRFQLGTSTGVETTGYLGTAGQLGAAVSAAASTSGFDSNGDNNATFSRNGTLIFSLLGSNIWTLTGSYNIGAAQNFMYFLTGAKTLGGTLDRVRITTVNGTDTFDAGSVNILYE